MKKEQPVKESTQPEGRDKIKQWLLTYCSGSFPGDFTVDEVVWLLEEFQTASPVKESGNEAIEFAEWIRKEEWNQAPKEFDMWYRKHGLTLSRRTSAQLYNLFKQTKP